MIKLVRYKTEILTKVSQQTINQRLIFLIEKLSVSARAFSEAIGESPTNTHNYIGSRQLAPKHEYLAKVVRHFPIVNSHWLLTGEGEAFTGEAPAPPVAITNKKNKGPVQNNTGDNNTITNNVKLEDCERNLASSKKDVEHLKAQLAAKDELLASKDAFIALQAETLSLLRGGYTRPN
ncbi:MAG: hypothetical protein ACRYFZ_19565 [Janthinobacterium lividum]